MKPKNFRISGNKILVVVFLSLTTFFTAAFAGESDIDLTYLPTVNNVVFSIAMQPDGKAVIGGNFTTVNGQTRNYVARLNLNGTTDTTFPVATPNLSVTQVLRQPDGKIIVTGGFTTFNGTAHGRIVRLNADGTIDPTFVAPVGTDNTILAVALMSNGQILIGGDFTTYNGVAKPNIARLNSDGSLDPSFTVSLVPNTASGSVRVLVPQTSGTIYVGGGFSSVSGATRNSIARLNANGTLDTTFNPGTADYTFVNSILPLASGQVMVGGSFVSFAGPPNRNALARLNSNGTLDTTFNANLATSNNVYQMMPQTGGRIILIGSITTVGGTPHGGIVRINADGTSDATFNTGNTGSNGTINCAALQPDGKILIGGQFLSYNGVNQPTLARLNGLPFTAAGLTVAGRVTGFNGRGIGSARLTLTEADGTVHSTATTSRGYFRFEDIPAGQTCVISITARGYTFAEPSRILYLTDDLTELNFVSLPARIADVEPTLRSTRDIKTTH